MNKLLVLLVDQVKCKCVQLRLSPTVNAKKSAVEHGLVLIEWIDVNDVAEIGRHAVFIS